MKKKITLETYIEKDLIIPNPLLIYKEKRQLFREDFNIIFTYTYESKLQCTAFIIIK